MPKSYAEFKSLYLGKHVDVDGFPAYRKEQCWDLVSGAYFPYIGGKVIHCGLTGYVKDIAYQRKTNGILDFCDDIGLKATLQPGDICITDSCANYPYSHIFIYDHDEGQNAVFFLGQNQPYPYVTIAKLPTAGIIGVFRPKIFMGQKESEVKKEVKKKATDQILTVGSKVTSWGFYVQGLRVRNKQWEMYNAWVGGWFPTAHVHEVDTNDGKCDNILHIGSGVAFDGTLTVSKIDVKRNMAYLKELGYWVYSRCLNEVEEGR